MAFQSPLDAARTSRVIYDSDRESLVFPVASFDTGTFTMSKKHLLVKRVLRSDGTGGDYDNEMWSLNGDTNNANYERIHHYANVAYHGMATSSDRAAAQVPTALNAAGLFAVARSEIMFARAGHQKIIDHYYGTAYTSGSGLADLRVRWMNTAAITRLVVSLGGSNFVSGSRLVVYEID